ncbi:hypothetical protein [Auritidibacter sp. NML130574]|nr:hypothetical protein [Auritidibacter sp. NML130574]
MPHILSQTTTPTARAEQYVPDLTVQVGTRCVTSRGRISRVL